MTARSVLIVDEGEEEVLERCVFLAALVRRSERLVQRLFEGTGE